MNLIQITAQVADNVGQDLTMSTAQLDRLVNRAVEHLVNVVEQTGQIWNAADTPKSVSVSSGTLEYQIDTTGVNPRKILSVVRTDVDPDVQCVIVPWRQRTKYQNRTIWGSGS